MILAPLPDDEASRLQALHSLHILDTPPDARLDCITRFISEKLKVPISLITFIDTHRQWNKSTWGMDLTESIRSHSICAHAICGITSTNPNDRIYEIYDLKSDIRFFDSPLVVGTPKLRSYIGFVMQSESNKNIGVLCLAGREARIYTQEEKELIIVVGLMVENIIKGCYFSTGIEQKLN